MGGTGPLNQSFTAWSVIATTIGGSSTASLRFNSNGTVTYTATASGTGSGSSNWYIPTTAGAGNSYYIRGTPTSGTFTSGPTTWTSMSGSPQFILTRVATGQSTVEFTVDIATDAAGVNIVFTSAGNFLSAENTI